MAPAFVGSTTMVSFRVRHASKSARWLQSSAQNDQCVVTAARSRDDPVLLTSRNEAWPAVWSKGMTTAAAGCVSVV